MHPQVSRISFGTIKRLGNRVRLSSAENAYRTPILAINEALEEDESISGYNIYYFNPVSGSQLNNPGNIPITVNNSDDFYFPHKSYLQFEGQVLKASDGKPYIKTDDIAFVNYGVLYLFDQNRHS